jgi:hypothetical protein
MADRRDSGAPRNLRNANVERETERDGREHDHGEDAGHARENRQAPRSIPLPFGVSLCLAGCVIPSEQLQSASKAICMAAEPQVPSLRELTVMKACGK